jgi:hypothetical protein
VAPAVHRLIPALGGLLLVGWGASYLTRPGPAAASVGRLAPVDSSLASPWVPLATLAGEALDAGPILAVDLRGDTLVLAHPHAVSVLVDGTLRHRFGSDVVGAPEFIGRGVGIALTAQGIAVLDAPQHRLDVWSPEGQRRLRIPLPWSSSGAQYGALTPLNSGVLLTGFQHGATGSGWWAWRVTPTTLDTLVHCYACGEAGAAFRIPQVAPRDSGFVLLDALTGDLLTLEANGSRRDSTQRPAHPRPAIPEATRRRVANISAALPNAVRRALDVGDFGPSARALTSTADGRLLVLTANIDDAVHVEVLDHHAQPVGRLWAEPDDAQLWLVRHHVIRLREDGDRYLLERLTPRGQTPAQTPSHPPQSTP